MGKVEEAKNINDYGAFPYAPTGDDWAGQPYPHPGMSLRDWFAGQALAGIKACSIVGDHHIDENTAKYAYRLADAMLAARQRSEVEAKKGS